MVRAEFHSSTDNGASIYQGIAAWAAHTSQCYLATLALLGVLGTVAITRVNSDLVAVTGFFLVVASIGSWGLIERRARQPHSLLVRSAEAMLAALGTVAALVAALGALFWIMGPAPVL